MRVVLLMAQRSPLQARPELINVHCHDAARSFSASAANPDLASARDTDGDAVGQCCPSTFKPTLRPLQASSGNDRSQDEPVRAPRV